MKRIKEACICQTLHFTLKEDVEHEYALSMVKQEVQNYKKGLDRKHTQYKIVDEYEEKDGSIIVKIKKQYNSSPVGSYLD